MLIFILLWLASSIEISMIPSSGTPPYKMKYISGIYDEILNRLIIFGGYNERILKYTSSLYTYDLSQNLWNEIIVDSSFTPPGLGQSSLYLRADRTLLVIFGEKDKGPSSDIFSFNLNTSSWKLENLSGNSIAGRKLFASCSFSYLNTSYIAIFGGATQNGVDNSLFL
jgi:hypothetical protein